MKVDPPRPINTQINPLGQKLFPIWAPLHNAHTREKNPCSSTFPGVPSGLAPVFAPTIVLGMVGQPPHTTRHHPQLCGAPNFGLGAQWGKHTPVPISGYLVPISGQAAAGCWQIWGISGAPRLVGVNHGA